MSVNESNFLFLFAGNQYVQFFKFSACMSKFLSQ